MLPIGKQSLLKCKTLAILLIIAKFIHNNKHFLLIWLLVGLTMNGSMPNVMSVVHAIKCDAFDGIKCRLLGGGNAVR